MMTIGWQCGRLRTPYVVQPQLRLHCSRARVVRDMPVFLERKRFCLSVLEVMAASPTRRICVQKAKPVQGIYLERNPAISSVV